MAELTFFEVHLHGDLASRGSSKSSGISLPGSSGWKSSGGRSSDRSESRSFGGSESEESGGSMGMRILVGLVLVAGLAAAVRVLRDGSENQTELEEFEEITPRP